MAIYFVIEVNRIECLQEKLFVKVVSKPNALYSMNSNNFLKFLKLPDLRLKRNWQKMKSRTFSCVRLLCFKGLPDTSLLSNFKKQIYVPDVCLIVHLHHGQSLAWPSFSPTWLMPSHECLSFSVPQFAHLQSRACERLTWGSTCKMTSVDPGVQRELRNVTHLGLYFCSFLLVWSYFGCPAQPCPVKIRDPCIGWSIIMTQWCHSFACLFSQLFIR